MAPGSRCMSGSPCGCRMSWTYRWAVMVPRYNTKRDRVFPVSRPRHHSKQRRQWLGVKRSTRNGRHDSKCPSARCLRMVREDTGAPNEGATCASMADDEAVDCTRAFLTMWRSSRRLVCRECPEPGVRVNDISWIHWSQHLLTTQSERPN
ncbi:uncharacterized protein TNCV_2583831 [Trichonephila clavipes]|nr:uncharacterized protein TNCV_2583831 [Trichonephila clavipes]